MKLLPALTASFAMAETSLELPAIFSPHLIASDTRWSTGNTLLTRPMKMNTLVHFLNWEKKKEAIVQKKVWKTNQTVLPPELRFGLLWVPSPLQGIFPLLLWASECHQNLEPKKSCHFSCIVFLVFPFIVILQQLNQHNKKKTDALMYQEWSRAGFLAVQTVLSPQRRLCHTS